MIAVVAVLVVVAVAVVVTVVAKTRSTDRAIADPVPSEPRVAAAAEEPAERGPSPGDDVDHTAPAPDRPKVDLSSPPRPNPSHISTPQSAPAASVAGPVTADDADGEEGRFDRFATGPSEQRSDDAPRPPSATQPAPQYHLEGPLPTAEPVEDPRAAEDPQPVEDSQAVAEEPEPVPEDTDPVAVTQPTGDGATPKPTVHEAGPSSQEREKKGDPQAESTEVASDEPVADEPEPGEQEPVSAEGRDADPSQPDTPEPPVAASEAAEPADVVEAELDLPQQLDSTTTEPMLADVVADLIDAADPEVADVMARLIDASDPELVAQLVDDDGLEIAEMVARLLDGADPDVAAQVAELADAPDRREVAEVLKLVDTRFRDDDHIPELAPEVAAKLADLDIEADLQLTSRPGEMAQFARLDNPDQMRVIIRVLCGLVAREDLPKSPAMPTAPRSDAEERRWPLSRARWPLPPPAEETVVKRDPLPTRPRSSKAS